MHTEVDLVPTRSFEGQCDRRRIDEFLIPRPSHGGVEDGIEGVVKHLADDAVVGLMSISIHLPSCH